MCVEGRTGRKWLCPQAKHAEKERRGEKSTKCQQREDTVQKREEGEARTQCEMVRACVMLAGKVKAGKVDKGKMSMFIEVPLLFFLHMLCMLCVQVWEGLPLLRLARLPLSPSFLHKPEEGGGGEEVPQVGILRLRERGGDERLIQPPSI